MRLHSPRKTGAWREGRPLWYNSVYMNRFAYLLAALLAASVAAASTGDVIRTAAELQAAVFDRWELGRRFDLDVRLVTSCKAGNEATFAVDDDTGAALIRKDAISFPDTRPWRDKSFPAGTRARITGTIDLGFRSRRPYAYCLEMQPTGVTCAPEPTRISNEEFLSGKYDCRLVTIRAIVRDIVVDEISPDYKYVILAMKGEIVAMPLLANAPALAKLTIGSEIEATGICDPMMLGMRLHLGRYLMVRDGQIRILSRPDTDPFASPVLENFTRLRPQDIAALGRHRAIGRVIAAWHGDTALLRCDGGQIVRIETDAGRAPGYGDMIEAVGFPESDLYRINLSRVIWRRLPVEPMADETPRDVSADELQTDMEGRRCFDPYIHGHAIRLRGIVRSLPGEGNLDGRFNVESGNFIVPVDASATSSALDGLSVGCEVSVAGTCVMEIDNWRPNLPFPAIRGFFIVVRRPSDVSVLSRPSWWTPPRFAAVVGALVLVLLGSLIWNASLKRQSERRGRELAKTAIAKAESDLKVDERTRLAVELHDSISQNLTGISLAIRAAERLLATDTDGTHGNLKLASTSLDSCRLELKNCLWDLRNSALDEADMSEAIRQTLAPHVGDAELSVRFNVPRERFSDKTAHAILHIIRELATNAVRHGHATHVRVAGSIEGDRLLFSVRDDGCGFDPSACPGMDEGHFGLQGVRERVNNLEGEVSIESKPGKGTKVSIAVKVSRPS